MKLRTLMVINTIVSGLFGLGFVLLPGTMVELYGVPESAALRYTGQLFGAALLGFAVLTWSVKDATQSDAWSPVALALFVGDGIGFIVSLVGQFGNVVNALGWTTVLIYLLLALGFGYFQFIKKTT